MNKPKALYGVYNIREYYLPQIIGDINEIATWLDKDKKAIYKSIRKAEVIWKTYRVEKVEV